MQGRYSIFASVGNATQPFERFLRMVDEAAGRTGRTALIQTGGRGAFQPSHSDAVDFVTRERFEELLRYADYVVTHAGVGSVMSAVRLGKLPIVVARRKGLGEHVNDHQLELAHELSSLGWCRVVVNPDELVACFQQPPAAVVPGEQISNQRMRELVSDFIR
jgi:UDP-N-acetylglucosamine transferase subunit ALG13